METEKRMDIPKQVTLMGLDFTNMIKAKLDSRENINATAVVMTEDMDELEQINDSLSFNIRKTIGLTLKTS